eukprot:Nitzschia sp. Nitz4//scaffold9_size221794//115230//116898//NITZ4_001354-RA/size221794-processed-gene-0.276-mRNA-1//1//CDS//3329561025//7129//frame0
MKPGVSQCYTSRCCFHSLLQRLTCVLLLLLLQTKTRGFHWAPIINIKNSRRRNSSWHPNTIHAGWTSAVTSCNPLQPLFVGTNDVPVDPPSNTLVNEYSFFDEANIYVRGGSGGQGSSTYQKGYQGQNGPPDGGNGGQGGNVYLILDDSLNTLAGLSSMSTRPNRMGGSGAAVKRAAWTNNRPLSFRAESGVDGQRQNRHGRGGEDIYIRVPPGTVVQECLLQDSTSTTTSTSTPTNTQTFLDMGQVLVNQPKLLVAKGGKGGEGSAINSHARGVRRARLPPQGGEKKLLRLTLKIVADVALVGIPNAGKSTFLASVTRAKPKIANYPFTTVIPNLGVWIPPQWTSTSTTVNRGDTEKQQQTRSAGSDGLVLCDVPGLIEGASHGVGLGHAFLRHIERCHVILHLVDATATDPLGDFHMLNQELVKYGTGQLAQMPQVVVLNKLDLVENDLDGQAKKERLSAEFRHSMGHSRLLWMSAKEGIGVEDLMGRLAGFVRKVKQTTTQSKLS